MLIKEKDAVAKRCPKFGAGTKEGLCEGEQCMAWYTIPVHATVLVRHKPDCPDKGKVFAPGQDECLGCGAMAERTEPEDKDAVGGCTYIEGFLWIVRAIQSLGGRSGHGSV